MNEDVSISITATAEDANLDVSSVATDDGAMTTQINSTDSGVSSISVTTDNAAPQDEGKLEIPKKFADSEDPMQALLKSYKELEKQQSTKQPETPETPAEVPADITQDRKKAESVTEYSELWAKQNGELTDEQWGKASEDLGISVEDLRAYEAYRKDQINSSTSDNDRNIYEWSGGEDQYNQMIDWAESNMNQAQLDALNNQLDNPQFSQMGVNMLKQMYVNSVGQEPSVTRGDRPNSTDNGDMFHSEAEVLAAQNHKDYGQGGAYDKLFDQKLLRYMKSTGQM
jgi:hypothetical protein